MKYAVFDKKDILINNNEKWILKEIIWIVLTGVRESIDSASFKNIREVKRILRIFYK